jgi:hypothetical protein
MTLLQMEKNEMFVSYRKHPYFSISFICSLHVFSTEKFLMGQLIENKILAKWSSTCADGLNLFQACK